MRVLKATSWMAALFLAGSLGTAMAQGSDLGGTIGGGTSGGTSASGTDVGGKASGNLGGTLGAPTVEGSGSASGATNVKPNDSRGKAKVDGAAKSELPSSVGKPGKDTGLNPGASLEGGAAGSMNAPSGGGSVGGNLGGALGR